MYILKQIHTKELTIKQRLEDVKRHELGISVLLNKVLSDTSHAQKAPNDRYERE